MNNKLSNKYGIVNGLMVRYLCTKTSPILMSVEKRHFSENGNNLPKVKEKEKEKAIQAPNRCSKWSISQRERKEVLSGLRFEGVDIGTQPKPLAGIDLTSKTPIEIVESRVVSCDGGGALGHPRIYINLVSNIICCN